MKTLSRLAFALAVFAAVLWLPDMMSTGLSGVCVRQ